MRMRLLMHNALDRRLAQALLLPWWKLRTSLQPNSAASPESQSPTSQYLPVDHDAEGYSPHVVGWGAHRITYCSSAPAASAGMLPGSAGSEAGLRSCAAAMGAAGPPFAKGLSSPTMPCSPKQSYESCSKAGPF